MNKPSLCSLVSALVFATACFSDPGSDFVAGTEDSTGDGDGDGDGEPGDGDGAPGDGDGEPGDGDGAPGDGDGEPIGCEPGSCAKGEYCVAGMCEAPPAGMVAIPAGPFWMGCNEEIDSNCENHEYPYHQVTLSAYAIDRTEVTAAAYAECVSQGECDELCGNATGMEPATCITWLQAETYCEWMGKHLPTEAQWEKAARGDDGRLYPWGNQAPTCALIGMNACDTGGIEEVGSYPAGASPYGVLDMAGNLPEWIADWYLPSYYVESPAADPQGPASGTQRVIRSGYNFLEETFHRTSFRAMWEPANPTLMGFRCAYLP